jgi:hypothetical protein
VVVELATAMVLLVGAGLLGKSLHGLLQVNLGLEPEHLATLGIVLPDEPYSTDERVAASAREIVDRIGRLPGVTSVGITSRPPLVGGNTMWIRIVGRPYHGEHNEVLYREVSPGYFRTLQARMVRGRPIDDRDDRSRPPVAIINQALAKQYFPGTDPIGQRLVWTVGDPPPLEIVGVRTNRISLARSSKPRPENSMPRMGMSLRIGTPRITSRYSVLRMPPMMRLSPCRMRFSSLVIVRSVTSGICVMPSGVR